MSIDRKFIDKYIDRTTFAEKEFVPFGSSTKMFKFSNFYESPITVDYSRLPSALPFTLRNGVIKKVDVQSLIPDWLKEYGEVEYPSVEHAWQGTGVLLNFGRSIEGREEKVDKVVDFFCTDGILTDWRILKMMKMDVNPKTLEDLQKKNLVGYCALRFAHAESRFIFKRFSVHNKKKQMGKYDHENPSEDALKMAGFFKYLLGLKFEDPELKSMLVATGDLLLVERQKFRGKITEADQGLFWGAVRCNGDAEKKGMLFGQNFMGQLMMQVRADIQSFEYATEEEEEGLKTPKTPWGLGDDEWPWTPVRYVEEPDEEPEEDPKTPRTPGYDSDDDCVCTGTSFEDPNDYCEIVDVTYCGPDLLKRRKLDNHQLWKEWEPKQPKKKSKKN